MSDFFSDYSYDLTNKYPVYMHAVITIKYSSFRFLKSKILDLPLNKDNTCCQTVCMYVRLKGCMHAVQCISFHFEKHVLNDQLQMKV